MAICCKRRQSVFHSPVVVMDNYWIVNGINFLKGCCGDPQHPIRMADCHIIAILQNINRARLDFDRLWPVLLPCEQERFTLLKERFPGVFFPRAEPILVDDMRMIDRIRKIPVWTSGPQGGLRVPMFCAQPVVQNLP